MSDNDHFKTYDEDGNKKHENEDSISPSSIVDCGFDLARLDGPLDAQNEDINNVGQLEADAVTTDKAFTDYQPNAGISPWFNAGMQGQKRLPLPSFERDTDNPKVTPSEVDWSAASVANPPEIHWPSVITTQQFGGNGDYYCYFGPHDTNGVGVAWFDEPFGDWTLNGSPVLDGQYGESGAFVKWDTDEVWVFENRPNTTTRLLKSPNGLESWTDDGVKFNSNHISSGGGHVGYPRPFFAGDQFYCYVFWKPEEDDAVMALIHMPDPDEGTYYKANVEWLNRQEPTGDKNLKWHHIAPVPYFNGWLVFWAEEDVTSDPVKRDIRMGYTTNGIHIRDLGVALGSDGMQTWEGETNSGQVDIGEPAPFWGDDGNLYLAYAGNLQDDSSLGIARADFSEVKA